MQANSTVSWRLLPAGCHNQDKSSRAVSTYVLHRPLATIGNINIQCVLLMEHLSKSLFCSVGGPQEIKLPQCVLYSEEKQQKLLCIRAHEKEAKYWDLSF